MCAHALPDIVPDTVPDIVPDMAAKGHPAPGVVVSRRPFGCVVGGAAAVRGWFWGGTNLMSFDVTVAEISAGLGGTSAI